MSLSQFHCTVRLYLDMHGLIFETSICYWQDQPGRHLLFRRGRGPGEARSAHGLWLLDGRPFGTCCVAGSRACYRRHP